MTKASDSLKNVEKGRSVSCPMQQESFYDDRGLVGARTESVSISLGASR